MGFRFLFVQAAYMYSSMGALCSYSKSCFMGKKNSIIESNEVHEQIDKEKESPSNISPSKKDGDYWSDEKRTLKGEKRDPQKAREKRYTGSDSKESEPKFTNNRKKG